MAHVFSRVFNKILKFLAHMTFYSVSAVIGYAAGYKCLKKYNNNNNNPHPPFSLHAPFIHLHIILGALFIIQLYVCERSPSNHNSPLIIKLPSTLYFPSTFMPNVRFSLH